MRPATVELTGPFAYAQLLVTATLDNGETADATRIAKFDTPASVAAVADGLVRPRPTARARSPSRSAGKP